MDIITTYHKIRFILNNHVIYNTKEKLEDIMKAWCIEAKDIDVSYEVWWGSNKWWEDTEFMQALSEVGVDTKKTIYVKQIKQTIDLPNYVPRR